MTDLVTRQAIQPGRALDIGCGTGADAIWLALQGFAVTGIDVNDRALELARENSQAAGVSITILKIDFLNQTVPGGPFGFIYDRGCFHTQSTQEDRARFAQNVADHLLKDGLWFSLTGNADENRSGPGPPRRTARDIVLAVEPHFEILSLIAGHFNSNSPNPPRAWLGLLKKRS